MKLTKSKSYIYTFPFLISSFIENSSIVASIPKHCLRILLLKLANEQVKKIEGHPFTLMIDRTSKLKNLQ
jgi:hypothetical protein